MDFHYKVSIHGKPDEIFAAITSNDGISKWWVKQCQVSNHVGDESVLHCDTGPCKGDMYFRIMDLKKNFKAVWKCTNSEHEEWIDSLFTYRLIEKGENTDVLFDLMDIEQEYLDEVKEIWLHNLKSLKNYIECGQGDPEA